MVDMLAYRDLSPDQNMNPDIDLKVLGAEFLDSDGPPSDPFVLLLPPRVKGFGFHDKKWREF